MLVGLSVKVGRGVFVHLGVLVDLGTFVGTGTGVFVCTDPGVFVNGIFNVAVGIETVVGDGEAANGTVETGVDVFEGITSGVSVKFSTNVGDGLTLDRLVFVADTEVLEGVTEGDGVPGPVIGITTTVVAVSDGTGGTRKKDRACFVGVKKSRANAS